MRRQGNGANVAGGTGSQGAQNGYWLLAPTLAVMALGLAAPLGLVAVYSLKNQTGISLSEGWTLAQYGEVLGRASYRTLFWRSLGISGLVTLVTVLLAYPMAYFVAFKARRAKFVWLIALTIPFWTSYLLRVFAWKIILGFDGVINSGLMRLGLIDHPLTFLLYNPFSVVVTLAHAWAAFAILPIYVSLEKIDRSLLEAATDLGDGPLRRFLRVTLPLSMPGVIGAAVLIFVPTTGDYVTPTLVGGPAGSMIANVIEIQFGRIGNWPMGSALALVSMTAVALVAGAFVLLARWATARVR
ncbi:MAG: ABC transporter permease [Alphaproteobacteria bacterium]|nr:ABC transporter permease [Alphaproteobacteria bacterium]